MVKHSPKILASEEKATTDKQDDHPIFRKEVEAAVQS